MGVDIHPNWIAKCGNTNQWFIFEDGNDARDYIWFGVVGGVRDVPYFESRGTPDVRCDVWNEYLDDNLHSLTWLKPSEVEEANKEHIRLCKLRYPEDRSCGDSVYQKVPKPTDRMSKIITKAGWKSTSIPWASTIQQFIGAGADFEECVMYVCGFDS